MPTPAAFRRSLILTGPTGSGKSALALNLADRLGAEIVAMDSMTLYRGLDVGTAKPSAADQARVPHHLLDVLDPSESANVAWWLDRAAACVADIEGRGKVALFVGGTPLYLKALLRGLFAGPPADPALRARLEGDDPAALHARLAAIDPPTAARLHSNDVRRLVRALEVWELTGRPISDWQREWKGEHSLDDSRVLYLDLPRAELYARIDQRVLAMLAAGWTDEARALRGRPFGREASAALGYRELWDFFDGRRDWDATVRLIQQRSRNYAKRQLTWFRHLPECRPATSELTFTAWKTRMN